MTNVLIAASEAVPFIKTGGLADVVGALPKYFDKKCIDARVIIPKYKCIDEQFASLMKFKKEFKIHLNWREQYVGVFEANFEGVTYYFVDNEFYFSGARPYGAIYEDAEKFAYFDKAVLEVISNIDFKPDIIHCNDWQTGLIPVFLKYQYGDDPYYKNIKCVYSIHNMKYQGRWRIDEVKDVTGLPDEAFSDKCLEAYSSSNFLKAASALSDAVVTVSPSYAKEITTPEGGEGLDGVMKEADLNGKLHGFLNGLDYDIYNPATDKFIEYNYTSRNFKSQKKKNKTALQKELGLTVNASTFMIGFVSRLTDQKGLDLLAYIMYEFLANEDVQIVVLGTGDEKHERMLNDFSSHFPSKLSVTIGYSDELAQKIYASSDAFLMPSLFEPCGLSQLVSMRYGSLPIVRETGGLKDTVEAYNEYTGEGTGFSFSNYNAHEMLDIIKYAMDVYYNNRKAWDTMVKRAMKMDFSWTSLIKEYETLYKNLVK
ncbi:MAG: glycogen synthase GlgA [Lachnospiraceae bacterium]|nr:glycogen synthase GlgA [Lachnospiraceae bacterium]